MEKSGFGLSITIGSSIHWLSLSILLGGLFGCSNPGEAQPVKIEQVLVDGANVTLRVKVLDENSRAVNNLEERDFRLEVDRQPTQLLSWRDPQEATPPPAWITVLLDLSGSMRHMDDSGDYKLDGAINAANDFLKTLQARGGKTKVLIVPFGGPGVTCKEQYRYPVDSDNLDPNNFREPEDSELANELEELRSTREDLCADTDLYGSLQEVVQFMGDRSNRSFYPSRFLSLNSQQPRLSVILLSDGYHSIGNEEQEFGTLINLLKTKPQITVHTVGYGKDPEVLRRDFMTKPGCSDLTLTTDLRSYAYNGNCKEFSEQFVDRDRLAQIADVTGGIKAPISADSTAIATELQNFLETILGEYELIFTQPNAESASRHSALVTVNAQGGSLSDEAKYGIPRSIKTPWAIRLPILGIALGAIAAWGIPFWIWANKLKQEAES